jgi:hypothetical protein
MDGPARLNQLRRCEKRLETSALHRMCWRLVIGNCAAVRAFTKKTDTFWVLASEKVT